MTMIETIKIESMKDENGLYPEDIASMLSSADPEETKRLRQIGKMRLEHSAYKAAWAWLTDIYDQHGGDRSLAEEGVSGLFYGVSGAGKSTILRRFTKVMGGPFETPGGVKRPVIRVSTPANPNLVNIHQAMLLALGAEGLMNNDAQDMRLSVHRQIAMQGVRLIIFDEFTHIVEDRSEKFAVKTMRSLKELLNEVHCNVVFAGTEELVKVHKLYGQMKRRSAGDMQLRTFSWDDEDDQAEWYDLMAAIQAKMLLPMDPPAYDEAMGRQMHQASQGVMDHLMKLLFRATSFAHRDGVPAIGVGHLAQAFERLRRGDDKSVNPFGASPVRRPKPMVVDEDEEDDVSNLSKRKDKRADRDGFTS